MHGLRRLLGALALAGSGVLFGPPAMTGCATEGARVGDGAARDPGAGAGESTSSATEDAVDESASDLARLSAFAPEDEDAQVLAQAICTALKDDGGWSFAVRRECNAFATDCNTHCANLMERQAGQLRCYNSLHIHANQPHSAPAKIGLRVYRYNSCGGGCGPNYCCCGS
jgi:hypothetical protein